MAGQDITADVIEIDERLSCSYSHTHQLETWHTGCRCGRGPCIPEPCTAAGAGVGRC